MYKGYKNFIFDLDGTLAYTLPDLLASMNMMLRHFGYREADLDTILGAINHGSYTFVSNCLPEEIRKSEELCKQAYAYYEQYYSRNYANETVLYPYVEEGIKFLKDSGCNIAVFSNKQDVQTKAICKKLFPDDTFVTVLGHIDSLPHKPSPEGALYIASLFGAKPEDVVIVGDSDIDMKLAENAGMHKVGVDWGYRPRTLLEEKGAEMILTCFEDFKKLI